MNALDSARSLLPFWVSWGTVLFFLPAVFLLALVGAWLGAVVAGGLARHDLAGSWVERARLIYPVRVTAGSNLFFLPALAVALAFLQGPLGWVSGELLAVLAGVAALAAGMLALRWVRPRLGLQKRPLAGTLAFLLIAFPHLGVYLAFLAIPPVWNATTVVLLLAGTMLTAFFACSGGLCLARLIGVARPASARLAAVVEAAAAPVGVSPRGTYEADLAMPNAFAFPMTGELLFSRSILELLNDEELRAIATHELGHLTESRRVRVARMASAFLFLPLAAFPLLYQTLGLDGILAIALGVVLISFGVGRLSRRMEERADRYGHAHEGSPGLYAQALARIYEAKVIPVVLSGNNKTHPDLYDRLVAAGVSPEYPRPAPPSRLRVVLALIVSATVLIAPLGLVWYKAHFMDPNDESELLWRIALTGGTSQTLTDLGMVCLARGDMEGAVIFTRAASALEERTP